MEVLATLQHSVTYETPKDIDLTLSWDNIHLLRELDLGKLPSRTTLQVLSVACGLAVWAIADAAMAQGLQYGDSGEEVLALQHALSDAGYFSGPYTGFFGSMTEEAVVSFQQNHFLSADGIVGQNTESVLETTPTDSASTSVPSSSESLLQYGSTGSAVTQLQRDLASAGYYSASGPFTEYFGQKTETGVLALQRASGISQDGIVGRNTRAALANSLSKQSERATPTSSAGSGPRYLKFGSRGSTVTELQRNLAKAGVYNPQGPFTEYFGRLTRSAVYRLQAHSGIKQDGIVGPQTHAAMAEAIAKGGLPPYRSASSSTTATAPSSEDRPDTAAPFTTRPSAPEPTASSSEAEPASPGPQSQTTTPSPRPGATLGSPTTQGFIRLKTEFRAFDAPNGKFINYTLGAEQVINYFEIREDGWIRIGVPGSEGSWIFAGENYNNVEFINGAPAGSGVPALGIPDSGRTSRITASTVEP
jgi:peptidoglycan hydrolase-like protein with peptidoglycan-binding domain